MGLYRLPDRLNTSVLQVWVWPQLGFVIKLKKPSKVAFLVISGIHQQNKCFNKRNLAFCDEQLGFSFNVTVGQLCSPGNIL